MRSRLRRNAIVASCVHLALACATLFHFACRTGGPGARSRDVLLVTVDTLRWDATGFSGAGKVETPALDGLAAAGRVFTEAHAHAVLTLPSHASILTGLHPYEHRIRDNAGFVLDPAMPTLATILGSAGYATAAFVSAFPLDRRFGLARGFDLYDDEYEGHDGGPFTFPERPGEETIARARAWWDDHAGQRRFMWVHLFAPHFPYDPPEPFASRYRERPYYGDAALADAQLAPLLNPIVAAGGASTVVVVTSDHGESLGEHGEATHGLFAYEPTLKVPLVLWAPGAVQPGRDSGPARHVDIVPTLLDLLGLEGPATAGRSLLAGGSEDGAGTYFEALTGSLNRGWAPLYGRIEGGRKAIDLPVPELYDLRNDPRELSNLAEAESAAAASILAGIPAEARKAFDRSPVDREVQARLRSLGYDAAADSPALGERRFTADDDPKNRMHEERRLFEALTGYRDGDATGAIRILNEMLERNPRMAVAYGHLSYMYTDQGELIEAVEVLRRALDHAVDTEPVRRKLALLLLRMERAEEAWSVLVRHEASSDPETQTALGRVAAMLGRDEEARSRIGRALDLDPGFPEARVDRGILLLMQDRLEEARRDLQAGLESDPRLAEGWNALGVVHSRSGDVAAAIEAWERALRVDPRMPDALFNLALALAGTGDPGGAVDALERYAALVDGPERQRAEERIRQLRSRNPG